MQKELAQIGQILRARREERRLSVREVENATSIRTNFIEAIEEGNLARLISPIYAQGFIKKYAAFLEIDGESLIESHPYVAKVLSEKAHENADFSYGIGSLDIRGSPGSEVKWLPNLLWVGLSVLLILGGWFLAHHFGVL